MDDTQPGIQLVLSRNAVESHEEEKLLDDGKDHGDCVEEHLGSLWRWHDVESRGTDRDAESIDRCHRSNVQAFDRGRIDLAVGCICSTNESLYVTYGKLGRS